MGRRRSPSYSRSPSRKRGRSPSRRKSRRDNSRSRSRGGKRGGGGGGSHSDELKQWGDSGIIVDLKPSGFGFIRPHTGKVNDKDLYFHCKSVDKSCTFDEFRVNDEVTYDVAWDDRKGGPIGKNVALVDGGGS